MRINIAICMAVALALAFASACSGGKQAITLPDGTAYVLQSSGKMTVYPLEQAQGAKGSAPLKQLRVKRKNETANPTLGCWQCTDCICNADDCACTECTSC
jgi:hypothetical protein